MASPMPEDAPVTKAVLPIIPPSAPLSAARYVPSIAAARGAK